MQYKRRSNLFDLNERDIEYNGTHEIKVLKIAYPCSDIDSAPTRPSMSEYFHIFHNISIRSWNSLTQVLDSPSKLQIGEVKERLTLIIL